MAGEEEEKPVDFIPELNVLGQPIQRIEAIESIHQIPKPKFNLEPSLPIDRFLAGVIDMLIVGLIIYFINDVWLFPNQGFKYNKMANYIGLLIGCLYHGFFDSSEWQGTPGKRWLGIRISNINGERISFLRSIGRYLASGISIIILLLGYVNIFINENKRAWHDIIAGTYVIREKEVEDVTYRKKRKNGYIIAFILFVITSMIYINAYTLEYDARVQKLEQEQEKIGKEKVMESVTNTVNKEKPANNNFIFNDSIHGFQILVMKGFYYSTAIPSFDFFAFPPDSGTLPMGWMVTKVEVHKGLAYGNYLKEIYKENKDVKVSNIQLLSFNKEGYGVEQGNIYQIKDNGDTLYGIERDYIRNKICYSLIIIDEKSKEPLVENGAIKQIFDSFKITE